MSAQVEALAASLRELLEAARDHPLLPLAVLVAFVPWGLVFLSPWLLVLQVSVLLPPPLSSVLCWGGMMIAAGFYYGVGRLVGAPLVRRFVGARATAFVAGARLETIILLRVVPLLPYTPTNLAAGAFGVPSGTFALGTAVGLVPLVLLLTMLGDRAVEVLRNPTPASVGVLAALALAFVGVSVGARRKLRGGRATDRAVLD